MSERSETCRQIAADLAEDVRRWEGQVLSGRTVATMFGELAACVAVLAGIVAELVDERSEVRSLGGFRDPEMER